METTNTTIEQITAELDRLGLSPSNGQEGVDAFAVKDHPELVVLADQEVECLKADEVLKALKGMEDPTDEEDERDVYERYGYAIQDLEEFDVEYDGEEYVLEDEEAA